MCLYIERLLTMLSCNFFVDFSWSLKHCSAWEESQIWQLPKLQAFLSLITYMLTHNILLKRFMCDETHMVYILSENAKSQSQ